MWKNKVCFKQFFFQGGGEVWWKYYKWESLWKQTQKEKPEILKGKILKSFLGCLNQHEYIILEMQRVGGNEVNRKYFRENPVRNAEWKIYSQGVKFVQERKNLKK